MKIEEVNAEPEPEMEFGSSSRTGDLSTVLGLFAVPKTYAVKGKVYGTPLSFICTSEEGQALKEGRWGNLDESLSFIDEPIVIVASSNGFLLCRSKECQTSEGEGRSYFICNPVTRQFRRLPKPHQPAVVCFPVFISKGDNVPSLDDVYFEVVRATVVPHHRRLTKTLQIETFSSLTNQWSEAIGVSSDSPFLMNTGLEYQAGFVIDEVIFWNAWQSDALGRLDYVLLAYDRCATVTGRPRLKVIETPEGWDGNQFQAVSDRFGPCAGKVHFARHDKVHFEVWVLEEFRRRTDWVRKYRVSLDGILKHVPKCFNLRFRIDGVYFPPLSNHVVQNFHPWDSRLVFITLHDSAFWYDMESEQKKETLEDFSASTAWGYFLYEWPSPAPLC